MSSTYNMGVQLFNKEQYNLACWPLDLAHKAAWAKVQSLSENKAGASVNDMVSEACAKCSALVDARHRNGEPGQARIILIDGLNQWAQAQTKLHPIRCPHSLVRSFVNLMCLENQPAEKEVRSLYTFICDIQPPLQVGIMGLLLEEALRNAKETFQLRSRMFKYVFRNSGKTTSAGTSNSTSNTSENGNPHCLREGIGPSATWSRAFLVKFQPCLSHPSHWRILEDYIESLMQVGVIYEQMGAVDEAEKKFREGYRLALAQNLPWALASFSSCLGEVHRKRHLWESAVSYFIKV
ncbi:unnamed protein product [Calypogeia fissa]